MKTFATLAISPSAFDEIEGGLRAGGYLLHGVNRFAIDGLDVYLIRDEVRPAPAVPRPAVPDDVLALVVAGRLMFWNPDDPRLRDNLRDALAAFEDRVDEGDAPADVASPEPVGVICAYCRAELRDLEALNDHVAAVHFGYARDKATGRATPIYPLELNREAFLEACAESRTVALKAEGVTIGSAKIGSDGSIVAKIEDDDAARKLFLADGGAFSIGASTLQTHSGPISSTEVPRDWAVMPLRRRAFRPLTDAEVEAALQTRAEGGGWFAVGGKSDPTAPRLDLKPSDLTEPMRERSLDGFKLRDRVLIDGCPETVAVVVCISFREENAQIEVSWWSSQGSLCSAWVAPWRLTPAPEKEGKVR